MTPDDRQPIPFIFIFITGMMLMLLMFLAAMSFGAAEISVGDVFRALTFQEATDEILIIREIRLPREVAAIFVGAALAVAGGIMQGITRNPLADPGLLGLTAGANASLAAALGFFPGMSYFGNMMAGFFGAALGAVLVFGIAGLKRGGFSPFRIVLAGAAVSAFLHATAQGLGLYFDISREVSMWTGGGLVGTNWSQLQLLIPVVSLGILIALILSRELTVLSLDEDVAVGLGQRTFLVKMLLFVVIILLTGAAVSLVGNLVFLGLMIPHMIRRIVGTDYRFILPMSAVGGATFMLLADTLGRTINAPYETSVAAIVSTLGLPFFLLIVRKGGREFL